MKTALDILKTRLNHLFLLAIVCLVLNQSSIAQVTIDQTMTPEELVQNVLLGGGITVSNVTFNGLPGNQLNNQIGKYTGPSNFVNFNEGIALVSGPVSQIAGGFDWNVNPNITGDPDLYALANVGGTFFSVNNCAILEFDFIPMGDSLNIRFVFMSQEYPGYTCSSFNDPFGFFLSGPGISGPYSNNATNIALIPGSNTPIGVNTINGGAPTGGGQAINCFNANPNWIADSQYYVWNNPPAPGDIQFPGMTVTLTAKAAVTCGEVHHIKLAIADASDGALDSGVIIEAGSFISTGVALNLVIPVTMGVNDSTILEGCGQPLLVFTRPADLADMEQIVDLNISGTATNGVDYSLIPEQLVFEIGQTEIGIPFFAPYDGTNEGLESVIISYTTYLPCADEEITTTFTFYIQDPDPLAYEIDDVDADCGDVIPLAPLISGGYGVYAIEWQNGSGDLSINVSPNVTTTYFFTVSDTCGFPTINGQVTVNIPVHPPLSVGAGPDQTINCLDALTSIAVAQGGNGTYVFVWFNDQNQVIGNTANLNHTTNTAGTVTVIATDECGTTAQDSFVFSFPPVPVFVDLGPDFTVTCLDITTLNPGVTGGVGQYFYEWFQGPLLAGTNPTLDVQLNTGTTITLNVVDECGNAASDILNIGVPPVPVLVDLGEDLIVTCLDQPELSAVVIGGVGQYSYQWTLGPLSLGTTPTIVHGTPVDANIVLTVTDECGNVGTDNINLIVPAAPIMLITKNDTIICKGDNLEIWAFAVGGHGGYTYTWSPVFTNATLFEDRPMNTTTYSVHAVDICGNATTAHILVEVQDFQARFDFNPSGNWGYQLINGTTPSEGAFYFWDLGDGNSSSEFEPEHYYYDMESHLVTLYGVSNIGCKDTLSRWFYPFMDIYVPSGFSPNGDGVNDAFRAYGHAISQFEIWIYNRWGELMFYSDDIDKYWIGNHDGGEYYAESEVFVYNIKARGIRGNTIEKSGTITLLR
jgi:gliding motility-associated-like protein